MPMQGRAPSHSRILVSIPLPEALFKPCLPAPFPPQPQRIQMKELIDAGSCLTDRETEALEVALQVAYHVTPPGPVPLFCSCVKQGEWDAFVSSLHAHHRVMEYPTFK